MHSSWCLGGRAGRALPAIPPGHVSALPKHLRCSSALPACTLPLNTQTCARHALSTPQHCITNVVPAALFCCASLLFCPPPQAGGHDPGPDRDVPQARLPRRLLLWPRAGGQPPPALLAGAGKCFGQAGGQGRAQGHAGSAGAAGAGGLLAACLSKSAECAARCCGERTRGCARAGEGGDVP